MSDEQRQVGKKGFGTAMLERLREVPHASTEELAKIAGVKVEQAYSRLMFLQSQEKMVVSVGKGAAKVWSLAGKDPPPPSVVKQLQSSAAVGPAFNRNHGWKPTLARFPGISLGEVVKTGDKLLIEYPEGWRHSVLVSVTRAPDATGVAQCWDLRSKQYAYAPVTMEAAYARNIKVARVLSEKDVVALENE